MKMTLFLKKEGEREKTKKNLVPCPERRYEEAKWIWPRSEKQGQRGWKAAEKNVGQTKETGQGWTNMNFVNLMCQQRHVD